MSEPKVMTLTEMTEVEDRLAAARSEAEAAETNLAAVARQIGVDDDVLGAAMLRRNEAAARVEMITRRLAGVRAEIEDAEHDAGLAEIDRYLAEHHRLAEEFNASVEQVEDQILAAVEMLAALPAKEFAAKQALAAAHGTARKYGAAMPMGANLAPRLAQLQVIRPASEAIRMSRSARTPKSAA